MKKFHLQCLAAFAFASFLVQPATAQRRGTGVSTLPETPAENSAESIAGEQQAIDANMEAGEAAAETQMENQIERTEDDLKAEEVLPDAELLPPLLEGSPDMEPASDLPMDESLPSGALSDDELPDPNTLIPDDFPPVDEAPPPPVVTENEFEKERKMRIRFVEVKLLASKDQAIRDMKAKADVARTDEDKRAALREYYRMLFARIVSIDAELTDRAELMEQAYLRRLGQFRVEPTIPMNPPPTPEALSN